MAKKSTGEKLCEAVGKMLKVPALVDAYVKEQPHLTQNEAFTEAALAAKEVIEATRKLWTLLLDTTTLFDNKQTGDEDEWKP
jgi:hypothetical protein